MKSHKLTNEKAEEERVRFTPIGYFRTKRSLKFSVKHQPPQESQATDLIEILAPFSAGLSDIEGFSRIWVITWFHKNKSWRPMILPPRGRTSRKGVFSTRSPHRPNPIGISAIPLLSRKGPYLIVGESDLIDGTPILDIKPYLPYADSFTDASLGWMAKTEEAERLLPSYQVTLSRLAHEQLNWLKMNYQIDFLSKAISILERDPHPHRTRRITRSRGGILQLACGPWRVIYELEESTVTIERIAAGYPHRVFSDPKYAEVADRVAQEAFVQIWP